MIPGRCPGPAGVWTPDPFYCECPGRITDLLRGSLCNEPWHLAAGATWIRARVFHRGWPPLSPRIRWRCDGADDRAARGFPRKLVCMAARDADPRTTPPCRGDRPARSGRQRPTGRRLRHADARRACPYRRRASRLSPLRPCRARRRSVGRVLLRADVRRGDERTRLAGCGHSRRDVAGHVAELVRRELEDMAFRLPCRLRPAGNPARGPRANISGVVSSGPRPPIRVATTRRRSPSICASSVRQAACGRGLPIIGLPRARPSRTARCCSSAG